jgi:hypothetical protein
VLLLSANPCATSWPVVWPFVGEFAIVIKYKLRYFADNLFIPISHVF